MSKTDKHYTQSHQTKKAINKFIQKPYGKEKPI